MKTATLGWCIYLEDSRSASQCKSVQGRKMKTKFNCFVALSSAFIGVLLISAKEAQAQVFFQRNNSYYRQLSVYQPPRNQLQCHIRIDRTSDNIRKMQELRLERIRNSVNTQNLLQQQTSYCVATGTFLTASQCASSGNQIRNLRLY